MHRNFFEHRAGALALSGVGLWLGVQILTDYEPQVLAYPASVLAAAWLGMYAPATMVYFAIAGYGLRLWQWMKRRE